MKIFDLKDNEVVVSPEILTILVFEDIWNSDKSKNKKNAYNDFKYIYHLCDFNSPYNNYSEEKRIEAIKEEVLGEKTYLPSEKVQQACRVYKNLKETPIERLFTSVKDKIEEMSDYLKENELTDDSVTPVLKIFDSMSKIVGQYKTLETAVKSEKESTTVKIRGDKKVDSNFNE
jgi:hypothetical protein